MVTVAPSATLPVTLDPVFGPECTLTDTPESVCTVPVAANAVPATRTTAATTVEPRTPRRVRPVRKRGMAGNFIRTSLAGKGTVVPRPELCQLSGSPSLQSGHIWPKFVRVLMIDE